ncbi:MAG TPA: hypothetical protein VNK45_01515, partial [Candidatus Acidoferrales bacterium]|nr:hypothetical protein [Candidatus Acidoferrales bacterium]
MQRSATIAEIPLQKRLSDRLLSQVRCRELFQGWMVRTMALSVESTLVHASDQGDLGQFAGAD